MDKFYGQISGISPKKNKKQRKKELKKAKKKIKKFKKDGVVYFSTLSLHTLNKLSNAGFDVRLELSCQIRDDSCQIHDEPYLRWEVYW